MKKFIDNLITFFLLIISVLVFTVTLYFCLDVFGIIQVPEKYSIASLFYSQIDTIVAANSEFDNTVTDNQENTVPEPKIVIVRDKEVVDTEDYSQYDSEYWENLGKQLERKPEEKAEISTVNTEKFYYEQLDEYGKIIYDKLYENMDKLKTGDYTVDFDLTFDELLHQENGESTLNNAFQLAINALTFDNPELFYIDVTKLYLLTEKTTRAFSKTYRVSLGSNGENYLAEDFLDQEKLNSSISDIERIREELISSTENEDTIGKIRIIHNYLVSSIEYDASAGENIYNIYGALVNHRSVCEGYARAFKYIMDDMGIPCIIACGIGRNSRNEAENHAWNYIQLDGKWYAIDVTWDDPIITWDSSIAIRDERISDEIRYAYFLKGSQKFFADHFEDGNIVGESNFVYPTLSETDY